MIINLNSFEKFLETIFRMNKFVFIGLVFVISIFKLTEGRLDIKCVDRKIQELPITYFGFGSVYSPGYTEGTHYPNNVWCQVNLVAGEGKHIRLTFELIDIAINLLCREDKLSVFDVLEDGSNVAVGQYCSNIQVYDFVSSTNKVIITFETSHIGTGLGFNITYKEVSSADLCKAGEFQCRSRRCIPNEDILCNGKDDCGDGTDEEGCDYPVPAPTKCGVPIEEPFIGNSIVDRIVGGREAVRGSWPWQVDMQYTHIQPNGHFCGGSLINSEWLITAAHCVQAARKPFSARVHLGNHHRYEKDPYEQIRYLKDMFVYGVNTEDFLKNGLFSMSHDLALVKLSAPVLMNPHVQAVCLPQLNEELSIGKNCFATGWGITRGSGSDDVLKQAEHPIRNVTACNNIFQTVEKETMICAGRSERLHGLCHGDSGGPLVCKKSDKWHVYGAASFVTDSNFIEGLCGFPNQPTVFSKISPKINWIQSTILEN